MKKALVIIVFIIAVLVAGFYALNSYIYNEKQGDGQGVVTSNEAGQVETPVAENPEGEADPNRMTLDMKEWTWIEALLNDESKVVPKKAGAFTLTFGKDGRFSAKTDCNAISGKYKTQNDIIVFSDMVMTKMFCEGSQERVFSNMLRDASHFHFTSRGQMILDLKFDSGTVTFR